MLILLHTEPSDRFVLLSAVCHFVIQSFTSLGGAETILDAVQESDQEERKQDDQLGTIHKLHH